MFLAIRATRNGAFAMVCGFIWIGIFNSIQSVCRERAIIKREYRTGLHISSYIAAHMIYEMILCFVQALIATIILFNMRSAPTQGIFTSPFVELLFTFFLVIFAADALGLLVSCVVKTETAAMTAMPFVLILQLVLSGVVFELEGAAASLSSFTISRWGVNAIGSIANINAMPGARQSDHDWSDFYFTTGNITQLWLILIGFTLVYGVIAIISLKFIDRDKR